MNENNEVGVRISFRLRNILELNGKSLESIDFSPVALTEVIELLEDDLRIKMAQEATHNREYRPSAQHYLRPVILIARLALENQPFLALTGRALQSRNNFFIHGSVLTEEAVPYWNGIALTRFQPQIHNLRSTNESTAGVWLGISEK